MADETDVQDAPAADAGAAFEAQQAAAEGAADAEAITLEQLAGEMGWAPKDKWRGNPDDWRPAGDFLKSTVTVNKSLRAEMRDIKRSVDRQAQVLAEQKFARLKAELEAKLDEAVDKGDKEAVRQTTAELTRLAAQPPAADGDDPETRFAQDNPWYGKNQEATALAVTVSQRLHREGKTVEEQLDAAETEVRKRFPELYAAQPRRGKPAPAMHDPGPGGAPTRRSGTGWNDLPADVQRDMERAFVRTGMVTDKALLAKEWFAENGRAS